MVDNARQITLALKLYAADHDGAYPDEGMKGINSSNIVFDELIQEGIVTSEAIFGSPHSVFQPDRDLSTRLVDRAEQVHWAFVLGRIDASDGRSAIVFENPVAPSGSGSPEWGPSGNKDRGRSWSGPRIGIAANDGSLHFHSLDPISMQVDPDERDDLFSPKNEETGKREELPWIGGR